MGPRRRNGRADAPLRRVPPDETPFFGREPELAAVARSLEERARLVTLLGVGGLGKTRLAVMAASAIDRPASFVALETSRSLEAAVREVAIALGVRLGSGLDPRAGIEAIAAALAEAGPWLLVLDGAERLGDASRELASGLLARAPSLVIVATSREPLGVRGEAKIVLSALGEDDAVALLRDRARAAAGDAVEIAEADARAIVRRVDGLPLAIELAASRLDVLSAPELLARLGRAASSSERAADLAEAADVNLDILADASGYSREGHRTMRATLDGSWEVLSPVERSALTQASVFAAPFGVEAAEEVVVLGEGEVLDVLERLVKRSLLRRHATPDRVRLGMFEIVRAWAREKLEDAAVELRHARRHLALAERAAARTYGEDAARALDTLADLLPELLAAFERTKREEPEVAARVALALADLFAFRGPLEPREELFAGAVDAAARSGDARLHARVLVAKARVSLERGRADVAEAELGRALDLAARAGDAVTRAEATRSLGWSHLARGRREEAEAELASAEALHRAHGNARGLADVHVARAVLRALAGRPADALDAFRAALAIHVDHGDVVRQEKVLGFAALAGRDPREVARGLPGHVVARAASLDELPAQLAEVSSADGDDGSSWRRAVDLYRRGALADERGDPDAAIALFDRALETLERAGLRHGLASIEAHAAASFAARGEHEEAAARLARARTAAGDDPTSELVVSVFAAAVEAVGGARREEAAELLAHASRPEIATAELRVATGVLERALTPSRDRSARTAPAGADPEASFVAGPECRWIRLPRGERIDLARYGPVRRLLERLVSARLHEPGVAIDAAALVEAGWPGERMLHSAGLLRVYSAIRRLRRLGLEPILLTRDDGYLLDPDLAIRREDPS